MSPHKALPRLFMVIGKLIFWRPYRRAPLPRTGFSVAPH